MKRHGNLFEAITSLDNLHLAYRHARKGKSWQNTVHVFEANLANNLYKIQQALINQTLINGIRCKNIVVACPAGHKVKVCCG